MRRRDFVSLAGGAIILLPFAPQAQSQTKVPCVGILDDGPIWNSFRLALRDLGYVEGKTIRFEYRNAGDNSEQLAKAVAELVKIPVDSLAMFGTPQAMAAKRATTTIPVVMISIGDPVGAKLVESIARPGGNLTGNTILGPEMAAKRLQILKQVLPGLSRLAFLRNPTNASNMLIFDELQSKAPAVGVAVIAVNVRRVDDFEGAFEEMMLQRPDALMTTNDPLQQLHMGRIIDLLARYRLPGMFQSRDNVLAGGLVSYGANLPELFRRGAVYMHKILQGTKPSDLPIEQPTKFELVVNMRTAKTLGLTIPESFLLSADEVIE